MKSSHYYVWGAATDGRRVNRHSFSVFMNHSLQPLNIDSRGVIQYRNLAMMTTMFLLGWPHLLMFAP